MTHVSKLDLSTKVLMSLTTALVAVTALGCIDIAEKESAMQAVSAMAKVVIPVPTR